MIIKFDVFGKQMSVIIKQHEWLLFNESDTGVRSRVYDVVITSELTEDELATYLDDIYHECASTRYPSVSRLN